MAEVYSRNLLKIAVAQICQGLGWHAVQTTPCEILTDVVERYIRQLAQFTHRYSEQYGKTDPTLEDLGLALHDMGFSISELNTYIKEVEPIPFVKAVPCFPLPKPSNFQHPIPGSKHCRERLHYIPDYLPPLVSIKGDPDTSDLAEDVSHSTSANGVHHEGIDTNIKSMKAIGPNFEAPFTPPRGEKRTLPSPYDGHDNKRMRRVEDGTPQELVTVTMEANGILTPKREGKLPDACTPPPKFTEKLKQKITSSSPLPEPFKLKASPDIKKSISKDGLSSKKTLKENELKKTSIKSDSKKQVKDNVESKKTIANENSDPSKSNKTSKSSAGKKSPKPSQAISPAVSTPKLKPQKSPKPSFSLFLSDSSFKYPTKQKSVGGSDKTDIGNSSKSPKPAPSSPRVMQSTKKSDLQTPTSKSQPATKKSDIYDFDDDEFDSPPKDKGDPKMSSPPSESSLNAMQEAFRSAVAKGKQEMEAGKSKQSSAVDESTKPDLSSLKNPTDASFDAAVSAVIKKKQKNTSLEKKEGACLTPKFAFKQALREQEAELKKQTTNSSNEKRPKKIKEEKVKDSLHSIKTKAIKKRKKIYKDKEKKLKVASNILDETKKAKKLPDLTFKLKTSGGETKIVKDSKQDKSAKLKFAPIPKLNIKRKDSTSLQVVQVKPEIVSSKKDDKKKDKKIKDKLKKKKKLKQKSLPDGSEDTVQNVAKKLKSEGEPLVPKITLTFGSSSTGEGSKRFVIKPAKPASPVKKSPSPVPQPLSPVLPIPTQVSPVAAPAKTPAKTSTIKKKKTVKPPPLPVVTPTRPITPTTTPSPTSKSSPIEIKLDSKIFSPYDFDSDFSNQSLETPRTPTTSPTPLFPKTDVSPTYKPSAVSPTYNPAESPTYKPQISPAYKSAVSPAYKSLVSPAYKSTMSPAYKSEVSPAYKSAVSPPYKSPVSPAYKSAVSPTYKPDLPADLPVVKPKETKPSKKSSNQNKSKSTADKKKSASSATNPAKKSTPERKTPSGPKLKPSPKTASPTAHDKREPSPAPVTSPPVKAETVTKANKTAAQSSTKAASKAKSTKAAGKATATKAQAKVQKLEERSVVTETIGTVVAETEEKIWICPTCNAPDDGSPMIGCDNCDDWYHWPCVKITKEPPEDQDWFCPKCRKKKRKRKKY